MRSTAGAPRGSSPTTTPARRSARDPAPPVRVLLADGTERGHARLRRTVARRRRRRDAARPPGRASSTVPASLRVDGQDARLAAHLQAGHARRSRSAALPYRGTLVLDLRRKAAPGRERGRARVVPRGRGRPRRCRRPGRRPRSRRRRSPRAPTRSRSSGRVVAGEPLRPLRRRAQPGLRRDRRRDAGRRRRRSTATGGRIVLYHGKVATTYFSSSSGGETMSAAEAIGTPVPYLVSVPDPYDTLSPYHDWGPVLLSAAAAAKALGLRGGLVDLLSDARSDGACGVCDDRRRPADRDADRDAGPRRSRPPLELVHIGLLALAPVRAPVTANTPVELVGVVRGLTGVSLEAQAANGRGRPPAPSRRPMTASFSVTVTPKGTTLYRLATGDRPWGLDQGPGQARLEGAVLAGPRSRTVWGRPPVYKRLALLLLVFVLAPASACARVRQHRARRRAAVVPDAGPRLDALADAAHLTPVKVAVIDSGIDATHPEFAAGSPPASPSSAAPGGRTPAATARSSPARSPPTRPTTSASPGSPSTRSC